MIQEIREVLELSMRIWEKLYDIDQRLARVEEQLAGLASGPHDYKSPPLREVARLKVEYGQSITVASGQIGGIDLGPIHQ